MGIFDKIFGKKTHSTPPRQKTEIVQPQSDDTVVSKEDHIVLKVVRPLTNEQRIKIEQSTILLFAKQLYMHYWTDNLVCTDRDDPEWQNKVMYFWKAEEPFPKKSLPPEFENFKAKYFVFGGDTSSISLHVSNAIPWFGMPGLGEKHACELNGQMVTIPELNDRGLVDYLEQVELTSENEYILTNREDYFFLIDQRITQFEYGNFFFKGIPIPIDVAYSIGGIHIVKKVSLNS